MSSLISFAPFSCAAHNATSSLLPETIQKPATGKTPNGMLEILRAQQQGDRKVE